MFRAFLLLLSIGGIFAGCEHSELLRHRRETTEINDVRIPAKQAQLGAMTAERDEQSRRTSKIQSEIAALNLDLSTLRQDCANLDAEINQAARHNKNLSFSLAKAKQRSQQLTAEVETLQQGGTDGSLGEKRQQVERLKKERDQLFRLISRH